MMKKYSLLSILLMVFTITSYSQTPIITNVVDGSCGNGTKFVEVYISGTVDLSEYKLVRRSNAGTWADNGADIDISAFGSRTDEFIYVIRDLTELNTEFPNVDITTANSLVDGGISHNGNDSYRIVEIAGDVVIDQFGGDIDGAGEAWEYTDSWGSRNNGEGPNPTFDINEWTFNGVNTLDPFGLCNGANALEETVTSVGTYMPASTTPMAPTSSAPVPTEDESNVVSFYSDTYTNETVANYDPNWGQPGHTLVNTTFDPTGDGSDFVLAYPNFTYQGTDLGYSIDLSDMDFLHVDIWVAAGTDRQVKVSPINNGSGATEILVEVPVTPGSWNSVTLAKDDFTGMTWDSIFQLKFDGQFNGDGTANTTPFDIYVDNIYFSQEAPVTGTTLAGPFNVLNGSPVTVNVNDAGNTAGFAPLIYDSFEITADWVDTNNAFSSEADIQVVTTAGIVEIDPPTSGAGGSAPATITFSGDFADLYDPATDGTLDLILNQSWSGSSADWSNITVTLFEVPACPEPTDLAVLGAGLDFIDIEWVGNDSANNYEVVYSDVIGFDPLTEGESFVVAGTESSATIENLTEDTAYEVYVIAQCDAGETGISEVLATQTAITGGTCEAAIEISTLPYNTVDSTSNYGDNYSGAAGTDCGSTSPYLNGDDVVYTYTAAADGALLVSLTELSDTYAGIFAYESCADIGEACLGGDTNGSSSDDLEFILNVTAGEDYKFVVSTWASPQSTDYTLNIEELLCSPVTDLSVDTVTATTADFSWSAAAGETGGYEYVLLLEGEELGVATSVEEGTTNTGEASLGFTGLAPNTSYDLYVRTVCAAGTSDYTEVSFATDCEPAPVNYEEDFEDFLNPCWEEATGTAAGPDDFGSSSWSGQDSPQTGSQAARNNMYNNTTAQWLVSQTIDLGAGSADYVLSYDIAATEWLSTDATTFSEDDEVGVMISTDGGTTWVALATYTAGSTPSNTGQNESIDLSSYSGEVQFGIYAIASSSTASDHWVYVDNFFVGTPPDCLPVANVSVSGITVDGADFSWDAQPNAVEYTWMVFAEGADPEVDTAVEMGTTAVNSASVSGLDDDTDYFVVIQTDCGADGESSLSIPVDFTTALAPTVVSVGNPALENYCYDSSEFEEWRFDSDDGSALVLVFDAGSVEASSSGTWDDLIIYDGVDNTGVVLFNSDVDGNELAGLSFTAQSGSIYMTLDSDGSVSCQSSTNIDTIEFGVYVEGDEPQPVFANVQVIHNSPDPAAASVDVYLNGALLPDLTGVDFRTASSFLQAPAGVDIVVDVVPAGADLSASVHNETFNLVEDENYIIVANGVLDASGFITDNTFELSVYAGAQTAAVDPTQVDVLVHHGSPDAPAVDVNESTAGNLVSNIAYPEFQGYLNLGVADYTLEIAAAGTPDAIVSYSAPLATLGGFEGAAITVVASGFFGDDATMDNGFGLWVATAAGGPLVELPEATISTIDFNSDNFNYYPNPVKNSLRIEASNAVEQIEVFNMLGQRVLTQRPNQTNPSLEMGGLETGVYLMKVSINGASKTFQVVKE